MIDNNVNIKGTGIILVNTGSEEFSSTFENGHNVSPSISSKKNCFRTCFDKAYDDICDGFIGCVAWYTNPMVPLITASYCAGYC